MTRGSSACSTATARSLRGSGCARRSARPTSSSRDCPDGPGARQSGLTGVVAVDPAGRTADVQGMCTYERLVDATLPHGLTPLVVPQLRTITLGGAVTGLGIESASWRNGLPHESVLEMDVLTGAGEVVTTDAHAASRPSRLPNSYGTLGYATGCASRSSRWRPVSLRHLRFHDVDELVGALGAVVAAGAHDGEPVDYVDGVVFSRTESYLVLGRRTDEPGPTSDYTGSRVYYRSIQHDDAAPRRDALDAMGLPLAVGHRLVLVLARSAPRIPRIRRLWPRRWLRSSVYWRLVALDRRFGVADRLEARHGRPPRSGSRTSSCRSRARPSSALVPARGADRAVWLCPPRCSPTSRGRRTPSARARDLRQRRLLVDRALRPRDRSRRHEPAIEREVTALGGHKSLYSESFYEEDEFARLYDGAAYAVPGSAGTLLPPAPPLRQGGPGRLTRPTTMTHTTGDRDVHRRDRRGRRRRTDHDRPARL